MTKRDKERVSEADDLEVMLPRSSGTGRPDQTLCVLALGRESVFGWLSTDVRVDHHCARRQTNALVAGRERNRQITLVVDLLLASSNAMLQ